MRALERRIIGILGLFTVIGTPLRAQRIATAYEAGTSFSTNGLTGFQTIGSGMTGMSVTATFTSGQTFTGFWTNLGTQTVGTFVFPSHGVRDVWGSVFFSSNGDTNNEYWVLRVASGDFGALRRLQFNGAPGRTLFDCRFTSAGCVQDSGVAIDGTVGSSGAIAAQVAPPNSIVAAGIHNLFAADDVRGVYSNRVALTGSAPVGDLFEQFRLEFGGAGLTEQDGVFLFTVDTDNALPNTAIVPTTAVPEPTTVTLLAAGLAGMMAVARRRAKTPG